MGHFPLLAAASSDPGSANGSSDPDEIVANPLSLSAVIALYRLTGVTDILTISRWAFAFTFGFSPVMESPCDQHRY